MRTHPLFTTLIAIALATPLGVHAQFEGILMLEPIGCQATGECTIKNKLRFTDPAGVVWEAKAGLVTDGASIPGVFQPFVGQPFDESFIKSAVIHDHYCDRTVRPWRQTHRVFYEALLDQGVAKAKAKVMYFAVYLGGPKWVKLIPGKYCGKNCINAMRTASGKPGMRVRKADYSMPMLPGELSKLQDELDKDPDALSLDQIDARAQTLRPGDYYYKNGNEVVVSDVGVVE